MPTATPPSASSAPSSSTSGSSSSTATTPWPSSAACTWPSNRRSSPDQGARVGPADGLPRAVHALHPLRRPARRPLAVPRVPAELAAHPELARALPGDARPRLRDLRAVARADAGQLRANASRRTQPTPTSCTASTIRAKACDALRGLLPAATAIERRHLRAPPSPTSSCCCACGRTRSPRSATYARPDARRAPQGHPGVPDPGGPARPGRGVDRLPARDARSRGRRSPRSCSARVDPEAAPEVTLTDFDPDGEIKVVARRPLRRERPARRPAPGRRAEDVGRRTGAGPPRLRRRPDEPPAQARAGVRADRPTASTSCATTARSATSSATGCSPSNGSALSPDARLRGPARGRGRRARATTGEA